MKSPLEVARWLAVHQEMGSRRRAIEVDCVPLWVTTPMRDAVGDVVDALVHARYQELAADGRAGRNTPDELERAVREHGRTLVALPDEAWALVRVYRLEDGAGVALEVPLWTAEEGRSDLTLSLTLSDRDGEVGVEIDDVHVL